jgi:hypothetical protein
MNQLIEWFKRKFHCHEWETECEWEIYNARDNLPKGLCTKLQCSVCGDVMFRKFNIDD